MFWQDMNIRASLSPVKFHFLSTPSSPFFFLLLKSLNFFRLYFVLQVIGFISLLLCRERFPFIWTFITILEPKKLVDSHLSTFSIYRYNFIYFLLDFYIVNKSRDLLSHTYQNVCYLDSKDQWKADSEWTLATFKCNSTSVLYFIWIHPLPMIWKLWIYYIYINI